MFESIMVGPKRGWVFVLLSVTALALLFATDVSAQEADTGTIILDTAGFWRCHYTIKPPVVRGEQGIETLSFPAKWLMRGTPLPPEDWEKPGFYDSSWSRFPGVFHVSPHYSVKAYKSPFMALECMRGKFTATDPTAVKGLKLSAVYRGGIVVYINGKEVARGHLPKGGGLEQLAEEYPFEEYDPKLPDKKNRSLTDVKIPAGVLRKGVNVLAIEVHRTAYDKRDVKLTGRRQTKVINWGNCGLVSVQLKSSGGDGVVPNVARPDGFQVWNSNPMQVDCDLDYGEVNEELKPIYIVGTPNGAFSGKVVVGSSQSVKGLNAAMSDLRQNKGDGKIAASAVQVRYAKADWFQAGMSRRYMEFPGCFGGLEEFPPAEAKVTAKRKRPWSFKPTKSPGVSVSFGVVQPVWITVTVPADAKPGDYEGKLTISATGEKPVEVPVRLKVCGWTLPDPRDYVTWVDIHQSPESVALQYKVPIWSDEHFRYLEESLKLLGHVGNKAVYLHLIAKTNAGNAETMVRWIKQPDGPSPAEGLRPAGGSYKHDFSPVERYLDLVVKYLGKPPVACLYVHDYHCNKSTGSRWADPQFKKAEKEKSGRVPVTAVDADGKTEEILLPAYDDPRSKKLWKPVIDGIRARLKQRGLEEGMMFGISSDYRPDKFIVSFFGELSPGTPWINQGHGMPTNLHGVPVKYVSGVWSGGKFPKDPSVERTYGWKRTYSGGRSKEFSSPSGAVVVHHPRNLWWSFPVTVYRMAGEMNIAGSQRGFTRLGADFWLVLEGRRGRRARLQARYPKTAWRNLNIRSCVFSPGTNGAISTHQFEMLREGIQECEARIFIEKAILGKKIPDDLAKRCQAVLDERIPAMRMGLTLLASSAGPDYQWWSWPGLMGYNWYVGSNWQDRSEKLYSAAAEVARALGEK